MKIRLSVLGFELYCFEMAWQNPMELLASAIAEEELEEEEEDPGKMSGGYQHNFERDTDPLDPDDRYDWPLDFGFNKKGKPWS